MISSSRDWISNDCIFLKGNRGKEPFPTSWQLAFHNDLPNAVVGRYAVFCCSHVELEIFDVYFHFFFQNNGVFDISDHSISTPETLESHTTFHVKFCLVKPNVGFFNQWNDLILSC
uniref:Uncharacterized protein n=1 Tax=Micrurus corallinus TaxID=54390 RepID=A0A2D4H4U2_MICCO